MGALTFAKALNAGLRRAMERDERVVLAGEDVGRLGGVFRITDGLQKDFGEHRVIDSPLAESGIVGTAIGLAMRGYRPVVEIQFDGFVYPAYDQIVCQLAKIGFRSGGRVRLPVVIRIPYGGGIGAVEHHSESPEAQFVHTPGLRVVTCADPQTAYDSIQAAVAHPDPVIFLEPKRLYHSLKADVNLDVESPEQDAAWQPQFWPGALPERPPDCTLVAYGPRVSTVRVAAAALAEQGLNVDVVELRTLAPLDLSFLFDAVHRSGRLVVVHEAHRTGGLGAEIAAQVMSQCFYDLLAPVVRVTGYDTPYPPARAEEHWLPQASRVVAAVQEIVRYD